MGLFSSIHYDTYDGKRLKNSMNVRYVKISKRVIGIDEQTFLDFKNLGDVIIPDSVEFIGKEAFKRCEGLLEIKMPDSILSVGDAAFEDCVSLRQVRLSSMLAGVSAHMFAGCKLLNLVVIPASVCKIDDHAFFGCESLEKIVLLGENPPSVYPSLLSEAGKDCKIYVKESAYDRYRAASVWHDFEPYIRPLDKTLEKQIKPFA